MKTKPLSILILLIFSMNVKAQTTDEDKKTFSVISFMAGYDAKINAPVSGLSFGVRTGDVYLGLNSIIPVTSNSLAPMMFTFNTGVNLSQFQPFISFGSHSISKVTEQYFKGTPDEYLNGFHFGYGCSYFLKSIPLQFTVQKTGKEILSQISIYKAL